MVPVNFDFFHSKNNQSDTYKEPKTLVENSNRPFMAYSPPRRRIEKIVYSPHPWRIANDIEMKDWYFLYYVLKLNT